MPRVGGGIGRDPLRDPRLRYAWIADDVLGDDGSTFSSWPARVGGVAQEAQASSGIIRRKATPRRNHSAVEYDGTLYMSTPGDLGWNPFTEVSIICVQKHELLGPEAGGGFATTTEGIAGGGSSPALFTNPFSWSPGIEPGGRVSLQVWDGAGKIGSPTLVELGKWEVWALSAKNGGGVSGTVNGACGDYGEISNQVVGTMQSPLTAIKVGGGTGSGDRMKAGGQIAAAYWFGEQLTPALLSEYVAYLCADYGIQWRHIRGWS